MKFLFVVLPNNAKFQTVPYGIAIVATVAKNAGIDVQVFISDCYEKEEVFIGRLVNKIHTEHIDAVCIGAMSPDYPAVKRVIRCVTEHSCITILGGYLVDASPNIVAKNIGATYCVVGEGEHTFTELANALENGKDINKISGLIYKSGDKLIRTQPRKAVEDLDSLPFIDGELCHYKETLIKRPTLHMMLSRSCPYNCTFCYHLQGTYYLMVSQILRERVVKIVDSKWKNFSHQSYCGMKVESPDTLINTQFDYLIISAKHKKMKSRRLWIVWE